MNERERLLAILNIKIYPHENVDPLEAVADYLLDNGVKVPVMCKDCKYWIKADNGSWNMMGRTDGTCRMLAEQHCADMYMTERDHFCSYGERKQDAKE